MSMGQSPAAQLSLSAESVTTTTSKIKITTTSTGSLSWSFPGGTPATSTISNPVVTYGSQGTYTAQLTAGSSVATATFAISATAGSGGTVIDLSSGKYDDGTDMPIDIPDPDWYYTRPDGTGQNVMTRHTYTGWSCSDVGTFGLNCVWITGINDPIEGYFNYTSKSFTIPQNAANAQLTIRTLSFVRNWTYLVKENPNGTEEETLITQTTWMSDGAKGWLNSRSPLAEVSLSPGKYHIRVQVYTNNGGVRQSLNVGAKVQYSTGGTTSVPFTEFTTTTNQACVGNPVTFTSKTTSGTPVSYSWEFQDGQNVLTSTEANPSITFSTVGQHRVKLTVTYANGLSSSLNITNYLETRAGVCDDTRSPNSYIFDINSAKTNNYGGIYIPVKKAYDMWSSNNYFKEASAPSGTPSTSVYWEDISGLIKSATLEGGKIKVMVDKSKGKGNAVIALHSGPNGNSTDPIYWSWHIWVTDDPSNGISYGHAGIDKDLDGNNFTPKFMDRNLGAVSNNFLGHGWTKTGGLMYQWGRKDPFPPLTYTDWGKYTVTGTLASTSIGYDDFNNYYHSARPYADINSNIIYSVQNPFKYIETIVGEHWFTQNNKKNVDLWGDITLGNTSGGRYPLKSPFDPCPDGWRVPSFSKQEYYEVTSSPWGRQGNSDQNGADIINPISGNSLYNGIKIYPGFGVDFTGVSGQNIGKYALTGKFWHYPNREIYQDQNSEVYLHSATPMIKGGVSQVRGFQIVADPARTNGPIRGLTTIDSHLDFAEWGAAVRCIADPNQSKIGTYVTQYIPAADVDYTEGLDNPNTYLMAKGGSQEIPVNKAYSVYNQYLTDHQLPTGTQSANVYWTTNTQLVNSVSLAGSGKDAKIKVVLNPNQTGNAVVSLHMGSNGNSNDPVIWSWQLWVPNGDPTAATFTYTTEDVVAGVTPQIVNPTKSGIPPLTTVFMDRNLGAIESFPLELKANSANSALITKANLSGGMHYQWGRKDPIPTFLADQPTIYKGSNTNGSVTYTSISSAQYDTGYTKAYSEYSVKTGVTSTDKKHQVISKNLKYSAENPLYHLYNTGESLDWISSENAWAENRWGHGTSKSPFDPCPEGWRVPDFSFLYHRDDYGKDLPGFSPWYNGHNNNGNGYGQGYGPLGSWYGTAKTTIGSGSGVVFDGADYQIGGYLETGIRGAYRNVQREVSHYLYRFGLWSSAMNTVSDTYYEGEHNWGRPYAGVARETNNYTFGASITQLLAYSAANIRCAKDTPRYTGATPLPSSQSRMVSSAVEQAVVNGPVISESNIQVSPNPNSGIFKVILKEIPEGTVQVIDMSGNLILSQLFKGDTQWEVNIQNRPAGVYFVRVQSSNQTVTKKIIKN